MPTSCPTCGKAFRGQTIGQHVKKCPVTWQQLYWQKVDKTGPGGCWLWTGALEGAGYGHFRYNDTDRRAHHIALELVGITVPRGMSVMHSCDVRNCVNPEHLRIGTHQENMADCYAKRRHTHGEKNPRSKLTEAQVIELRTAYNGARGEITRLANERGLSEGTVRAVVRGVTWRYVK